MACVLSVPPGPSCPLSISFFIAGLMNFRRAKYGTSPGSASGRILATIRPLSVTRISPCCEACRTSSPVRLCSSLIVTVFMCLNVTRFEPVCQSAQPARSDSALEVSRAECVFPLACHGGRLTVMAWTEEASGHGPGPQDHRDGPPERHHRPRRRGLARNPRSPAVRSRELRHQTRGMQGLRRIRPRHLEEIRHGRPAWLVDGDAEPPGYGGMHLHADAGIRREYLSHRERRGREQG